MDENYDSDYSWDYDPGGDFYDESTDTTVDVDPYNYFETQPTADEQAQIDAADFSRSN